MRALLWTSLVAAAVIVGLGLLRSIRGERVAAPTA
jgi:hypothetical protein